MSNPNVRYRIERDEDPIETGDLFTAAGLPDVEPEERAKMEKEYLDKLEADGGPWGCIIERKCGGCGVWEMVESCWGFDSLEGCESDAQAFADAVEPAGPSAALRAACEALDMAYANGKANGGSMDWEDVDVAWERAKEALTASDEAGV